MESTEAPAKPATAHKKGLQYEREFETYMRDVLGFDFVAHRSLIRGKNAKRPLECDLRGSKISWGWRAVGWVSTTLFLVLTAWTIVLKLGLVDDSKVAEWSAELDPWLIAVEPRLQGFGFLFIATLPYAFLLFSIVKNRHYVWVECRARKTKIVKNYVYEVCGRRDEAKKDQDEVWIVSSSGFDEDALTVAHANKIHCITFRDGKASIANGLPSQIGGL